MDVQKLTAGGVVEVDLRLPDGLPKVDVLLSVRPKTLAEFDAALACFGGAAVFKFPESDSYWDAPAVLRREGGASVFLYPPPRGVMGVDSPIAPRPHPFFAGYATEAGS